jgi:Holliday junction resolvase
MMTTEKKVKAKLVEILKAFGALSFYASTGGYGASGVPDIICCYKGRFIGIECKAGKGKTTALQEKNLNNIMTAGGTALVVNEDNIEDVRYFLGEM